MDNLKTNINKVLKLNAKAMKGSLNAFNVQLEIGRLCAEGYQIWRDMPKDKRMKRDELVEAYGYKKTFFGYLRQSAEIKPEDVQRYIESVESPTYSIKGLLAFMKPDNDKPKTWYTFTTSKEIGGGSVRLDEKLNVSMNGDKEEIIENLKTLLNELERTEMATIELTEVEEVTV